MYGGRTARLSDLKSRPFLKHANEATDLAVLLMEARFTLVDSQTTASLVGRAQKGDDEAFTVLVRHFLRPAYAIALGIVRRAADAEDVAQDACVAAYEKIDSCREPERFASWLFQIVRHRALNWLDQRRLRDVAADPETAPERVALAQAEHDVGLQARLIAALVVLEPKEREVVLLHDLKEWTHGEIAQALLTSEGMSRQYLFTARKKLRAQLGDCRPSDEETNV